MPLTKLAKKLFNKYARIKANYTTPAQLTKLGAIMLRKLATSPMYTRLGEDLENKNFSDRSLGKIPKYLIPIIRQIILEKYKQRGEKPPIKGSGNLLESGEYFLSKDQMKHLFDERIIGDGFTGHQVADGLENALRGSLSIGEASERYDKNSVAIHAPIINKADWSDLVFGVPANRKFSINTYYPVPTSEIPNRLKADIKPEKEIKYQYAKIISKPGERN